MEEAIVSAILEQLFAIGLEQVCQEVKLVTGVENEIKKLQCNFESIHALLDDAEERQIKERSIKLWLDRLKEVCYDMEDVLDEWSTALLKMQIVNEVDPQNSASTSHSKGKVCLPLISCFSSGCRVVHRRDIALKIKEINESLDGISKEKDMFQLTSREINRYVGVRTVAETTTFADLSLMHGRDEDKKQLVRILLLCGGSDEVESNARTISVVGLGGIGKTVLAQLIYKDSDVEAHFDKRIWVCVSEDFDLVRVAKAILQSLGPGLTQDILSFELQILLERICQTIEGKKVLLVLDDVWADEKQKWEPLKQAFATVAPGSRILVTTRKVTVAEAMKSFHVFHIKGMSDEVCWKILRQEAFAVKGEEQCKNLEDIGIKIAEKCRGLPLTARTLGGMLHSKKTRGEWYSVLNDEIWKLELVQKDVFAPLLLSYYDLPSAIRRCLLYCSVFPKDHWFRRKTLIREWMAQGYVCCKENREMEELGEEYFECLIARSFFHSFFKCDDGSVGGCKMHDMIVDFARFLMGNEFAMKELDNIAVNDSAEKKTRHLLILREKRGRVPDAMLSGAEKLRSLTIFDNYAQGSHDLFDLCWQPKRLRSLNFSGVFSGNEFPTQVGKLMHLRLLNLSRSKLQTLPESICDLYNLQSLYLKDCYHLEKLPDKIEKLINLRCFDTRFCTLLKSYPKGISRLVSLRDLLGIVVRCDCNHDAEFSLGDLRDLCNLRCLEQMRIVGDKIDANEVTRAKLHSKKHLKDLEIFVPPTMDGDDIVKVLNLPSHTNASTVSQKIFHGDADEFDLDLEDITVMEAIWLSIQENSHLPTDEGLTSQSPGERRDGEPGSSSKGTAVGSAQNLPDEEPSWL